jgi:iron complex outermembrane receptor protein
MRAYRYLLFIIAIAALSPAQTTGTLRGVVRMDATGDPVHGATVAIVQLQRSTESNDDGVYEFPQLPPGLYDVTIHMDAFSDERRRVQVTAGTTATADFNLKLSAIRQQITVTASGREQSTFDSFQAVTSLDSLQLAEKAAPAIGEVLDRQPGVAKRSFGPGPSRPVIRGFDGDRVLILQDGVRTGALSYQSGDHGEAIDASSLDRLEVVKGPATLLYGSNAVGGVVNAVTRHHAAHEHPHEGLRGFVSGAGGSANGHGGGNAGFELGRRKWLAWAGAGGQRTGDYSTPLGRIENSHTRTSNAHGGFGRYGDQAYFNFGYGFDDARYGIPPASEEEGGEHGDVDIALRRHNLRFNGGFRNVNSWLDAFRLTFNYSQYRHREIESTGALGTLFENRQFVYRGSFEQKKLGRLSGSFGFWGMHRDYEAIGEEALAPPVKQNAFAVFGLEEVNIERLRLQFGARVEHNRYDPLGLEARSFTGLSGSAGVHVGLWRGGAFVANYIDSYRAPALEELYNHGPHPGNATFEIGNAALGRERSHGLDLSLRHASSRVRAEVNLYRYDIRDFVFLAPTGEIEDDLFVADYRQGDARYTGAEAQLDLGAHPNLWLNLGMDYVDAQLKNSSTPLPRIPPLRGRLGVEARWKSLAVKPEVVLASAQHQIFPTETRTAGYTLVNLGASYTVARQHYVQVFSVQAFNLGDRLYRNHLSFIKDFAPEIGRGIRFTYTLRFF